MHGELNIDGDEALTLDIKDVAIPVFVVVMVVVLVATCVCVTIPLVQIAALQQNVDIHYTLSQGKMFLKLSNS